MDETKIQLSAEEFVLVQNTEWLLTKHHIIGKVYYLFGELAVLWKDRIQTNSTLPIEITNISPKISKGEQYNMLPYVMLDYPRYFRKEEVCAIRTFFWWGNFFSVTLHLKGKWKTQLTSGILSELQELAKAGFALAQHGEEWNHTYEREQFINLKDFSTSGVADILHPQSFCKLTAVVPLKDWKDIPTKLNSLYDVVSAVFTH